MIRLKNEIHDRSTNFLRPTSFRQGKTAKSARGNKIRDIRHQQISKTRKSIPKVSQKRKEELAIYEKIKPIWRKEREEIDGFRCEVVEDGVRCFKRADRNPHHKRGRQGRLVYDKDYFMAACKLHHHDFHHVRPRWAYEKGYLILK